MIPAVVQALGTGRGNAVKRSVLANKLRTTDRQMRKQIAEARENGWLIMCDLERGGYYLADNLDELEAHYRVERSRALKTLLRLKATRKILKEAGRYV